ncbi:hypothetical protein ACHHV8_01650 [Paenibacillus sp. TAB 01]|uniref:hypothetical protein n=1 Tax=Paenibacillus sp. TAB 01 TaxID=3368988 RepID=UPI003752C7AB
MYPSNGKNSRFTYGDQVPGNISLNHTNGIQFIGNTIRHMGASGIHLYNDASNTLIQGYIFTVYTLDGGAQQTGKSVNITEEGNHSLNYWSFDNAGKVEAGHTVSVKIDKTSPVRTAAVSPAQPDGLNGWYVHAVTVSFKRI